MRLGRAIPGGNLWGSIVTDVITLPTSPPARRRLDQHARRAQPARDAVDFWPTPEDLIRAFILYVLPLLPAGLIWECAAGDGRLARAIAACGKRVMQTDLIASPNVHRLDFLHDEPPAETFGAIAVTNPPNSSWDAFLARGLSLFDGGRLTGLVLLLRLDYLQAATRVHAFNRATFEIRCNWRPIWIPGTKQGRWSWHWLGWLDVPRLPPRYVQLSDLDQPPLPLFDARKPAIAEAPGLPFLSEVPR
jgi:hypothetical protein